MPRHVVLLALAATLSAAPVQAQVTGESRLQSILQAIRLPKATQEARALGVPDDDIRGILDQARRQQVPPSALTEVLEGECESIREHGPIDNFGAFVQGKLDQGLRGRDLSAAIRAEHAARGKGKGHAKGSGGEHGATKAQGGPNAVGDHERTAQPGGKSATMGKGGGGYGKSAGGGKPDTAKARKGGGR